MGPYCKFCNNRCFVPTTEHDKVTSDLKATCDKGILFDELCTKLEELNRMPDSDRLKPIYIERVEFEIESMKKRWA